ncbi:fasciclin domain-containing protein [Flavobacterium sp. ZB4P13]|uniref:fasciclin domain-containing protein n=1 Tax=Flavobacterium sp. ZB4P13 TaxID=3401728 RepID=UPI003AAE987B
MKNTILLLIVLFSLYSCSNDDYLVDGGVADSNVKMSTYDFLKSNKQLDTLALLIERADMIAAVNAKSTTLFAPNNSSIKRYVNYILVKKLKLDPQATFTVNDIPVADLKVMLGNYIFNETIDRSKLVKQGKIYKTLSGEERLLSLEPVAQYAGQLDNFPEYVFYTFKGGAVWDPTDNISDDPLEGDWKTVVRTSNLVSTNGIIHVLQGYHIFSNYIPTP